LIACEAFLSLLAKFIFEISISISGFLILRGISSKESYSIDSEDAGGKLNKK
jgi:hypothetical protein